MTVARLEAEVRCRGYVRRRRADTYRDPEEFQHVERAVDARFLRAHLVESMVMVIVELEDADVVFPGGLHVGVCGVEP